MRGLFTVTTPAFHLTVGQRARSALGRGGQAARVKVAAAGAGLLAGVILSFAYNLWPFVVAGINDGSIYALAAVSLVLTYKTSGIFNFAIGAQAASSAYVFYSLRDSLHLPWPVAALLVVIAVGLVGSLMLERLAYLLADAPAVMKVVATIGLLVLLQSLLTGAYGQSTIEFKAFLPATGMHLGSVNVLGSQIITVVLALVATMGLYVFFRRARLGIAMQAVVDDPRLLSLEGTNPATIRRAAWAIGSCFVSISGMLIAPELGIDVNLMLLIYTAAFGAAALASFTSLPTTFVAALGIGIIMNIMDDKLSSSSNQVLSRLYEQIPFLVLVAALLLLPRRRLIERATARARRFKPPAALPVPWAIGVGSGAMVLAVLIPRLVASAFVSQYTTGLAFAVILGSLGLLLWTSGQISLCQMAFAAVGATTFSHAQSIGLPWFVALISAGLVAVPVGALIAIPSFRLSGIYLAVATFAAGLLFQNLIYRTFLMFGTGFGLSVRRPHFAETDGSYYYVALTMAAICGVIIVAVRRSRLGRLMRGLADSPAALDAHGADTRIIRLYVFCISAFVAAVGGALLAGVTQSVTGDIAGPFGYFNSVALVAVLAFCGRRALSSPVVAALLFEVIKVYKPFSDSFSVKYEGVGFGILAIAVAVAPGIGISPSARTTERRSRPGRTAARSDLVSEGAVL